MCRWEEWSVARRAVDAPPERPAREKEARVRSCARWRTETGSGDVHVWAWAWGGDDGGDGYGGVEGVEDEEEEEVEDEFDDEDNWDSSSAQWCISANEKRALFELGLR